MKGVRSLFAVLLCFYSIVSISNIFSQDSGYNPADISVDNALFSSYLDTADQKKTSEQWLDYARFGLESALSSWEKEVLLLTGEDFDLSDLRDDAEAELDGILKERYAEWLNNNFFNSVDPPSLGALSSEIAALNEQYLYDVDDNGNMTYKTTVNYSDAYTTDAMGNETLIQKGEKALWVEGVKSKIAELLDTWGQKMTTAFSELRALVTDLSLLEELEQDYLRDYESYQDNYRNQLYRLYNTEQSRFTNLRLYDQYSLEHQSEQETASNISKELIAATQAELNSKLEALVSGLNAQAASGESGDGIVNAEDWRESFSTLLTLGMNSWDEAEQELLMKRIEWEQDAAGEVSDGEEAWADAFRQLSEKRTEWMNEYRETLQEGNLLWAEESLELEEAIAKAVSEIDESIANSEASLQSRIDNLVGMLLQSVNMMRTARTSWEYWMDRFDEGEKGSFDTRGIDFDPDSMLAVTEEVKNRLDEEKLNEKYSTIAAYSDYDQEAIKHAIAWIDDKYGIYTDGLWSEPLSYSDKLDIFSSYDPYKYNLPYYGLNPYYLYNIRNRYFSAIDDLFSEMAELGSVPQTGSDVYDEAVYWIDMFRTYQEYALDAQQGLAETYGIVVFDNASLQTAFTGDELNEALLDNDLLFDQESWEAIYLDEYQVELLKARAYMQYWRKQQEIAQAVYDYAADNSSTKENAEVTSGRLADAKAAYEEVLAEYTDCLDRLANISTDLETLQADMQTIQEEIDGYQQQLDDVRSQYNSAITDLDLGNAEYLAGQYREYYIQLLESMGMTGDSEESPSTALEEYLLAASEYGLEDRISLVSNRIVELLSGGENTNLDGSMFNPETASLSELGRRMQTVSDAGFISGSSTDELFGFEGNEEAIDQFNAYLSDKLLLPMSDYRHDKLIEYFTAYTDADTEEIEKSRLLWQMQLIAEEVRNENSMNYELRLAELRLLSADDFSSWAQQYFGDEAADADPQELIGSAEESGLTGITEAVVRDLQVYEEILDLYQQHVDSGDGEFVIYEWGSAPGDTPPELSKQQALQILWDYRSGDTDEETASDIFGVVESLGALVSWLESLGSLDDDISILESAVLNPDEALGQQYLKAYLSGRRNLATDMGDMYSVIYSDSVSRQKYTKGFAELLSENIDYAPCLSAYGYEKSRAELIEALSQFGMIDADTLIFHAPEAVWDVRGFSTAAEVADFFTELDTAASGLQLPEYLAGIFEGYRGELKDYFAIRAASAFFGEFSGDPGPFNEEIRLVANSMSSMGALTGILQKSSDQSVKLLALAVSDDVSDELREEAEFRLIETAGFDLANDALDSDGFSGAGAEWNELFDNYISAVRTGLGQEDGIEDYRSAMTARAAEFWELSLALAAPDSVDPDSAPEQWLESYSAMIWNSLDFDEALDRITGTDSTISISLLEQLRIIDQLMPETSGDFPSDVELKWLYGGNEVLREVDSMIVLELPELWAGDSFDIAETVKSRYYSDEDISVMEGMLVLTIEESEAGVTTVDKAVQLWNDQFDGGLADGRIDGLLKAFYGLGLINSAVEAAGEYSAEYEYEDLLAELLDGAVLSEDNLALLEDAVLSPAEALDARLDKLAELDSESLSGEDLYWNLAWNLRSDAAEEDYSRTAARGARIFDDIEAAGVISNWISSFDEANFESYSEKLVDLFDSQMSKIAGLAQSPAGGVYASIAACGIGEVLVEQAGYSASAAADFVNWFLTKKGIIAAFDPGSLADYLSLEPDARFYSVLSDSPDAASHYIKKQIAEGAFTSTTLSLLLDSVNLADEKKAELVEIQGILDDVEVYNELLHGDFEDFLDDRYGSEEQKRTVREIYMRFMGSTKIQWDDSVFMLSSDCGAGAREILDNLSFNRTRGSNLSGLNPGSGTGANEVFFSEALMTIYEKLYEGDDALTAELSALQSERDLQVRAADYLGSLETIDSDNWRSFLNDEYLSSEDDELNLIPASTVDYNYSDYTRNLQINNNDGDPVFQNFDSLTLFSGTGNDQLNIILDAANSYLDYAAYLTAAINSWDDGTISATETMRTLYEGLGSADGSDFRNSLESKSYAEINQAYLYEIDASVENGYKEARSEFYNLTAKIESIKESLSNFGYRRARLVRMAAMGSSEQLAEFQPLNDEISALEADIDAAQAEWQELIDGADGYRMLEEEYAGVYAQTKAALEELDVLKQEYSTARAIYEYASAGYLSIDDEILSEFDPVETDAEDDSTAPEDDETEVESGITGGTMVASDVDVDEQTADQAYRDALLVTINKVSPAERLAYINEKLARAEAANDSLETIINGGSVTESIYSKDEVYRAYFDNYLETFRESLVLNKINLVLNKAIARQETVTREALSDWNTAIGESYGTPGYLDSEGNAIVPFGLDLCTIIQNADGSRDISWDGEGSNAETFRQYFEANEDSETGLSDFQNDLMLWLEKVSGIMNGSGAQDLFTTWAMALKWEEFQAAGAPGDINDNFWNDFLNKNGEGDLDREGAKSLLITEWQNAFNKVNSCAGENKRLYNFYKLLDKGGIMQLNTDTTTGGSFETFELLGKNESVVLANQYMSDEYNQDAKNFFIASIPMFSMAVAYFAAATLALAIPFNWIAAIILFALGTAAALGGAHMVGEGNAKKAAADYIQNKIVKPAEYNSTKFMLNFKQNTSLILEKKQVYEEEFAKLQRMKGEAAGDETLTDEKRIELMRISTIEAFANEGEDLHSLLFQGGLVSETGNTAADTAALEALFGDYQEKMDQSEKDESVNSSLFISALEEESQDYKQITARELNDYLTGEDGVAREQAEAEEAYRSAYYQYLAEEISLEEFEEAAESAFGNPAFSVREHMLRLYEQQAGIAEIIMGSDQFNAAISAELLESQELLLCGSGSRKGIYDYKMSNYREVRMYGLQMLQLEMNEKYRNWENRMRAISARGELEWSAGERKLTRKYTEWQKETKRLYNRQSEAWDDKYLDFLSDKQAWLDAVMIQSTKVGDMDVLENFGEMTGAAIAAAGADVLAGDFSSLDVDPDTLLSEVVDFELLGTLLENAQSLNDSINDTENVIFTAAEPDRFTTADSLQAIKDFQSVQNEEYEKHLAELELERMLEQVEDAEESFNESIGSANKSLDSNINQTMRNDGYTRSGGRYERELVVGATIGGYVYEDGYVSTYDDYLPENIDFGSELKDAGNNVENLDSKGLQGLVARAMENIQEQLERIFGSDDETENAEMLAELGFPVNVEKEKYTIDREDQSIYEEPGVLESVANWVGDIFNIPEDPEKAKAEAAAAEKRFAEISPGLFGIHVGYAPEFADNADTGKEWDDEGQIKYEGLGEMGRIMGEFIFNKMKEGAGWAEVNMPHYKKPLWEGEIFGIEAPSAADLTSLAVTICTAGAASGAGAILSATINLSDDFALSAMDIATGDKSLLEGTLDFGKKAFVSLAGASFSEAGDAINKKLNLDLGGELLLNTSEQIVTNTASGAINAIEYTEEGGWNYNWNTLEKSVAGESAVAGYIGSAAGTVTTFGLNELNNSINANGFYLGDLKIDQEQIGRVNSMIGGIAGEAAGSLIDKDFSLNVLNLADIMALAGVEEENTSDLGLFEVHMSLDDEGNFTSYRKIGTGGAQVSYRDLFFDADTLFNSMARIQSINEDTAAAAVNRDVMLGIGGRVLDSNDIDFKGNSEIAGLLLYQLDETRSSKSYENLVNLFESADRLGENYLDSQLAKAVDMGDLKGDRMLDMLKNQAFNTTGSYELADSFFDRGRGLTAFADARLGESGFDSGYFVKSRYESGTEADLDKAFEGVVKWFAEDENGNSIAGDANGLLGGDVFDVENHITEMLYNGDFSSIEENLLKVGGYSQTLNDAMQTIVDELSGNATNDSVNEKLGTFAAGLAAFEEYLKEHPEIELKNLEIADFDHEENTYFDEKSGCYLPFSISGADDVLYIHTKDGYDYVDAKEAVATGRDVGSFRKHKAIDVGTKKNESEIRYQLAIQDMNISLDYNDDGLWVNSVGDTLMRETTHNTARSLELLTRTVLGGNGTVNADETIHIDAGYVIGKSGFKDQGFDSVTGPSTGPHSHEITYIKNVYGRYVENSTWLKNTFSSYVKETQDAAVFSGIQDNDPIVDSEYLRVKYMWDNRDINSDYFDSYMESNYGIDNADWQDYLKACYWESYTSYMQGMGY